MAESTTARLEKKVDSLLSDVSSMKSILQEREKTEILRNEVIAQSMKIQDKAIHNLDKRVESLEDNQSRITWLIVSSVILAILGAVLVTMK